MKAAFSIIILFSVAFLLTGFAKLSTGKDPWTEKQLLQPSELVKLLNSENQPLIFNLGPSGTIKGSIVIGPASEKENLEKLRKALKEVSKTQKIVIYCGCCPFEHCPNIRPAFTLLNEMKFSNAFLLNLPDNLKTDWIDKGYPISNE